MTILCPYLLRSSVPQPWFPNYLGAPPSVVVSQSSFPSLEVSTPNLHVVLFSTRHHSTLLGVAPSPQRPCVVGVGEGLMKEMSPGLQTHTVSCSESSKYLINPALTTSFHRDSDHRGVGASVPRSLGHARPWYPRDAHILLLEPVTMFLSMGKGGCRCD